jgi:hypothetical protein
MNWLKDWQTLTAGILAIIAAVIGGLFIWWQTILLKRQEQKRINRKHAAARAVLPLALSALIDYAEDCTASLTPLIHSAGGPPTSPPFVPPKLDPEVIPRLRDLIESADEIVSGRVFALISDVQILAARLRNLSKPNYILTRLGIESHILRAAVIYARGEELLRYARHDTNEVPLAFPSDERLHAALTVMGFDASKHKKLIDRAKKDAQRSQTL